MSFSLGTAGTIFAGFPGLLERPESYGMPPFQQSRFDGANYQEFEGEISDVLNSALIEHGLPLARAWVPCVLNRKCWAGRLGHHPDSVSLLEEKCEKSEYILFYKNRAGPFFHLEKGEGIVGKAFMTNQAFVAPNLDFSSNRSDRLCGFHYGVIAVPLRSSIHNSKCVFEFLFPFNCTNPEERKKIATALFSTLKQCCRTLRVVADKVLVEPSNSTFLAFPSLQPFDTVEQSVAKDSLMKENPREADPKRVMQQLPESSDQNERCPDPTPRIEPAKTCDAIGLGSLAASETSEERHATGEKTVNVPNISLNDSAKSTGGFPGLLECSERNGMPRIQLCLSDKDNYQDFEANLSPCSSSLLLDVTALQHFDTVELSVASDSLFPKENPREADPKHVMQLLPESSDQNEKCPDPRPRLEPAEMFDAISLGSLAANETSEERHVTGEKTVNVPNTSLNNSAKSTGGKSTGGAGSKRHWAWEYCTSTPGNCNGVICSFCDLEIKGGGISRFTSHISGSDPSKNVKKCKDVPPEVKAVIEQKGKKRR